MLKLSATKLGSTRDVKSKFPPDRYPSNQRTRKIYPFKKKKKIKTKEKTFWPFTEIGSLQPHC
jgi:hypothetical protein